MGQYPKDEPTPILPHDEHRNKNTELDSPAGKAFNIAEMQFITSPADENHSDLPTTIRGLYVGSAGNVFCKVAYGNTVVDEANVFFRNVVAGTILPVRMKGVYTYNITQGDITQNTTATFLVGLY